MQGVKCSSPCGSSCRGDRKDPGLFHRRRAGHLTGCARSAPQRRSSETAENPCHAFQAGRDRPEKQPCRYGGSAQKPTWNAADNRPDNGRNTGCLQTIPDGMARQPWKHQPVRRRLQSVWRRACRSQIRPAFSSHCRASSRRPAPFKQPASQDITGCQFGQMARTSCASAIARSTFPDAAKSDSARRNKAHAHIQSRYVKQAYPVQ